MASAAPFLGRGGMSSVWQAYDEELGRPVAIKLLHTRRLESADSVDRFEREARTLALLTHPGIVTVIIVRAGRRAQPQPSPGLLRITIHEGRNRQVRRMCEAVGHPVTRLVRVRIGPLRDAKLRPGEWRELGQHELKALVEAAAGGTRGVR